MSTRALMRQLPPQLRRELEIVGAIAREDLLGAHIRHALELVELGRGRVRESRMVEIYARLHRLDATEAVILANRVLATLGERRDDLKAPETPASSADAGRRFAFSFLRRRLRGRVHKDLRRWVELHTGRAGSTILRLHAEHAEKVANLLRPADIGAVEAVEIYADLAGMRESLRETLTLLTLDRLSESGLPWIPGQRDRRPEAGGSSEPAPHHRAVS